MSVNYSFAECFSQDKARNVVQNLYAEYLKALDNNDLKKMVVETDSIIREYTTKRFFEKLQQLQQDLDISCDPFIQAQDFDSEWFENFSITNSTNCKHEFIASYSFLAMNKHYEHSARIFVVLDNGLYKINKVIGSCASVLLDEK